MKLRDHPKLRYNKCPVWPPVGNEEGVLKKLEIMDSAGLPGGLYLTLEFSGQARTETIYLDDPAVIGPLHEILKIRLGWSISRLSDLRGSTVT